MSSTDLLTKTTLGLSMNKEVDDTVDRCNSLRYKNNC